MSQRYSPAVTMYLISIVLNAQMSKRLSNTTYRKLLNNVILCAIITLRINKIYTNNFKTYTKITKCTILRVGWDNLVDIATRNGPDDPGIEPRWERGAKFSAPIQTGPGAHPASYKMGTGSLSRE